jgi:hypothetical protein
VLFVVCLLLQAQTRVQDLVVMTSGTFTAAHLELAPEFERSAMTEGVDRRRRRWVWGPTRFPVALKRGDAADVVIVNADALDALSQTGSSLRTAARIWRDPEWAWPCARALASLTSARWTRSRVRYWMRNRSRSRRA